MTEPTSDPAGLELARAALARGEQVDDRNALARLAEQGSAEAAYRLGELISQDDSNETPEAWWRRAAEGGHREAMHALGVWYLEQFDDEHYRELLEPAALAQPISERTQMILESQARLTTEEREQLREQAAIREQALRWLRAAAGHDDLEACVQLAEFQSRSGDEALKREAINWYERAAGLGDVLAMQTLARLLKQGWGVPADAARANSWYARAAERFEQAALADDAFTGPAMASLAELLMAGDGVPRDVDRGVLLLEQAAARGYHWALIELGECYERGKGVPQDLELARKTFERAIAAGADSYARHCLKRVEETLEEGSGTETVEGIRVPSELMRAAEGGEVEAMWGVSRELSLHGDAAGAVLWLERAANSGHAVAAFTLFIENVSKDEQAAHRWMRKAAGLGHVSAMHSMGDFWLESDQGAADPAYGYAWIELASRERHTQPANIAPLHRFQAKQRAANVWAELSPEQRVRAADLVARCDAGPPYKLPDEL